MALRKDFERKSFGQETAKILGKTMKNWVPTGKEVEKHRL